MLRACDFPACSSSPFLLRRFPDRRLRLHLGRLYAALDEQRQAEGLTWAQLAELLNCTRSQLTGIRTAKFGVNMDIAMAITQWLNRPAAAFIYASEW